MSKEHIKKTLAGIGIAGLITSIGLLTGNCKSGSAKKEAPISETEIEAKSSCGKGSKTDTTVKGSCGKGSCGKGVTEKDTTAKGSCGKGSCGKGSGEK
jgi:hypothetical protein